MKTFQAAGCVISHRAKSIMTNLTSLLIAKKKQTRMSFTKNILLFFFSFAAKKQENRQKSRKVNQS